MFRQTRPKITPRTVPMWAGDVLWGVGALRVLYSWNAGVSFVTQSYSSSSAQVQLG